jgi:hypothetical protein
MPPKRKAVEFTMDSGSSSDEASQGSISSDSDTEDIFYESIALDATGRANHSSSVVTMAITPSPPAVTSESASQGVGRQSTWIYDFMDNDWVLPEDVAVGAYDGIPPSSDSNSDSDSNMSASQDEGDIASARSKRKREPVCLGSLASKFSFTNR